MLQITGLHHVTAVTAKAADNYRFYTHTLGLRLVKKTVNQDDVSAYHLFYADGQGSPGTDLTFFDWPAAAEKRGSNSFSRTGLRVASRESLEWWDRRLANAGVERGEIHLRDDRLTLDFEDGEGQRFCLVDDGGEGPDFAPWEKGPVPPEKQIRGLGPVAALVRDARQTEPFLTELLGFQLAREYEWKEGSPSGPVRVYQMAGAGPAAELHLCRDHDSWPARQGAGGVHHIAFRTPTEESYRAWAKRLADAGVANSGPVDRFYFRSLYFRDGSGLLFEIATDGPGFASDEPKESLGERLALPPFLEPRRAEIEAGLKPLPTAD